MHLGVQEAGAMGFLNGGDCSLSGLVVSIA
jgi:hypothetical protein